MRTLLLLVLVAGCGRLPPSDEDGADGSTPAPARSADASADATADAATRADAGVQTC